MRKRMLLLLTLISIIVSSIIYMALPVLANNETVPTTGPTILSVNMYENCLTQGDEMLVAEYIMTYTPTQPVDPINVTFIARLVNVNMDQYGITTPFAYENGGYNRGVISLYWPAGSSNLPVWGSSGLTFRLEGNPADNWSPSVPLATYTIQASNWQTITTIQATSIILGNNIISLATDIGNYWNVSLVSNGTNGAVLTTTGQTYFLGAIPQLNTICPKIFSNSASVISYKSTSATYSTGTATFTNGSTIVSGNGTSWSNTMVGANIMLDSDNIPCVITAVGNATTLTIANPYTGTGGTGPYVANGLQANANTLTTRQNVLGLYTGPIFGIPSQILYAVVVLAVMFYCSMLLSQAIGPVGAGAVGIAIGMGSIPLFFVYFGVISAVLVGILVFLCSFVIVLFFMRHISTIA